MKMSSSHCGALFVGCDKRQRRHLCLLGVPALAFVTPYDWLNKLGNCFRSDPRLGPSLLSLKSA